MNLSAKVLIAVASVFSTTVHPDLANNSPIQPELTCPRATAHVFLDDGAGGYSYQEFCITDFQYVSTHMYIEANMGAGDALFKNGFDQ